MKLGRLLFVLLLWLTAPAFAQTAPVPATVRVVLHTGAGDIIVAVETQRAPISARNFLRYVDQRRLDGASFYRAMTIGPQDVQRAQAYAPRWADLYNFQVPSAVVSAIQARGMTVQRIADAMGELNLDRYEIVVDTPPAGMDGAELLKRFLHNINGFVDTDNTEFNPYGPADAAQIVSANPVGAVFNLNIIGPDNAAVVVSAANSNYFRVSTVNTPDTGDHPVSGHREWGHTTRDGRIVLYTRGADRATGSIATSVVFAGGDHLWRSFQRKMVEYINANGGSATAPAPFSERFHPEVVRILYGTAQSQSAGMAAEDASDQLVRPVMPNDQRARAQRIGGAFGERIGQALDLGLNATSVDPLLDKLDPPAAPSPYGRQQAAAVDGQTAGADVPLPPAPAPRARAMEARAMGGGADALIEIGGILLERILNNEGDVSWELDQFNGIKHPNDSAPANPGPFRDAPTIRLNDWPSSGGVLDSINAWFKIDWQYNGRSLGNVRIENIGTNDAIGWGLVVKARIMNDARLYEPGQCAALRVTIHYKFSRSIGSDQIGITEIKLYGDGTHEISQDWEQNSWLFGLNGGGGRAMSVTNSHNRIGSADYSLAGYDGMKAPANPPAQPGPAQSRRYSHDHRPWVDAGGGQSVRAPFSLSWSSDGHSVGNVRMEAGQPTEAPGWAVRVSSEISELPDAANGCAQLQVRVSHQFTNQGQVHATEWTTITLRGDGTSDVSPN
ncbi:MAG TPA: peptidylprolyl isomerase [Allosphingosinicella sp.]|nr:peptidylprolyl isomerase [Allosphingosinicella sp.]